MAESIISNNYVRKVTTRGVKDAYVDANVANNQYMQLGCKTDTTNYVLIINNNGILLFNSNTQSVEHSIPWNT